MKRYVPHHVRRMNHKNHRDYDRPVSKNGKPDYYGVDRRHSRLEVQGAVTNQPECEQLRSHHGFPIDGVRAYGSGLERFGPLTRILQHLW